jgi:hypothetical protein
LGDGETAAAAAAQGRSDCPEGGNVALEWEFYFRMQLGQTDAAATLAALAPRRLALFFTAWLELAGGVCGQDVELEADGELPCRGLPREFCSRQYGRILLSCGKSPADYATAARYLGASLPLDPEAGANLGEEGRRLLALTAEAELLSGRYAEALRLYDEILRHPESAQETGLRHHRAEALRLLRTPASERAALAAYEDLRGEGQNDVIAAVFLNNLAVLRVRLGARLSDENLARDLKDLEALLDTLDTVDEPNLLLRHSLLTLNLYLLEHETALSSAEKLARLQQLQAPFVVYREELKKGRVQANRVIEVEGVRYTIALLKMEETP